LNIANPINQQEYLKRYFGSACHAAAPGQPDDPGPADVHLSQDLKAMHGLTGQLLYADYRGGFDDSVPPVRRPDPLT